MKCNDYDPLNNRILVFERLRQVWKETKESTDKATIKAWHDDIWRKANTLQAVAQYWHTATNSNLRLEAVNLMKEGYKFYCERKHETFWVDDWGWWGGFFLDLREFTRNDLLESPFDQHNLLSEAQHCYDKMCCNLDKTTGGIWNHLDPPEDTQEKNTITNSWILHLAANLFLLTREKKYKDMAEAQYKWLTTGNTSPWHLYNSKGFLLWLPGLTTGSDKCWIGDEGVFFRALSAYFGINPSIKEVTLGDIKNLITAEITPVSGFVDTDNVIHAPPDSQAWNNDLATGKGVFMRLVTRFVHDHAYFSDKAFEKKFNDFVNATAQSAWYSRDRAKNETAPDWNPGLKPDQYPGKELPGEDGQPAFGELWPQVWQTDGLDALNAAVQITK
jgi:Glycosyl hydrolase family 76